MAWSFRPHFLPESFTPDHKPLMGEAPELRGFYLGCGFNSAGEPPCTPYPPQSPSGQVEWAWLREWQPWGGGWEGGGPAGQAEVMVAGPGV